MKTISLEKEITNSIVFLIVRKNFLINLKDLKYKSHRWFRLVKSMPEPPFKLKIFKGHAN